MLITFKIIIAIKAINKYVDHLDKSILVNNPTKQKAPKTIADARKTNAIDSVV